jgi:hypothetical protein
MKNILRLSMCIAMLFLANTNAYAQMIGGKWYFPDSVKTLCLNYEQNLVALYKGMIERNRDFIDPNSKNDKSNYAILNESTTKAIQEYEISWDRLGCAHIIYGAKK